jgi:acyl-CoA thioester hydrolase
MESLMPSAFVHRRLVEFSETDMAGIVHFAQFFRYMEAAEHAFLRSLGLSVHMELEGRLVGWPRVHASCDYRRPLRFEDEVEVRLTVREKGERSLTYDFAFVRVTPAPEEEVARGSLTVVCVSLDAEPGGMRAIPIPPRFADQLSASPGD